MKAVRSLALAALVGAGAAAKAMNNGTPQGEVIKQKSVVPRDDTCAELPKLCTGPVIMYGFATTLTYLCPETSTTRERSTTHVTITKTITVTPPEVETTEGPTAAPAIIVPAPALTEEADATTTIHRTLTQYKTINLVGNHDAPTPADAVSLPAVSITGYLSATLPTELMSIASPLPTNTEEPVYTIQTSTLVITSTSGYDFPTMSPPVLNGTTTGIFYSEPVANSSLVQPTPFFPNTTSTHLHYALPTLNVENRAAETTETAKGTAGKVVVSIATLSFGLVAIAFFV